MKILKMIPFAILVIVALVVFIHEHFGKSAKSNLFSGKSRIEKIHDELMENNVRMMQLGQGAIGYPDENDSEEIWIEKFLPLCQQHEISADNCKAEVVPFRNQWIANRNAEKEAKAVDARKAEDAAHAKAISQGYEQDPYPVAVAALLREDYGTGIYLQNFLKQKYIPDIETKAADIKADGHGGLSAEFTGSDGSKFTYSLYLGSIDRMRKKDFKDIVVWSPVSAKARQVYTEMTNLPFVDLNTPEKCAAFKALTKESALAALKAQGLSFTEYDRQSTEYYFARDGMPDKVDPGDRVVKGEKVTVDPCGISITIREKSDVKDAKAIFSALIKLIDPHLDPVIFEKCVGKKLDDASNPDHQKPFEPSADCRVIPGLVVGVGGCKDVMFNGTVGCYETSVGFTVR